MERQLHIMITTLPTMRDAEKISRLMVEESLAVCVQVSGGCRSWYRWQGSVEEGPEVLVRLKLRADRLEAARGRLQALHPYETPMIMDWPVAWVDPGYLAWAYGEGSA
jgi:periplasmic divalent cation tolerance protein